MNNTHEDITPEEHTPDLDDLLKSSGPMTSMLNSDQTFPNREARRKAKKHAIGPEAIARETAVRATDAQQKRRMREIPEDVRDLLSKITTPEVLARTKNHKLHEWTRSDTLDLFFTLALVHAKMVEPLPASEDDPIPPTVQLIQAGDGAAVFYPVTNDSTSHVSVAVNDPRHYLSAADRDLINDEALDALNGLAERMIMGVYSLAMSLIPGSDAHEIAELLGTLNEMEGESIEE